MPLVPFRLYCLLRLYRLSAWLSVVIPLVPFCLYCLLRLYRLSACLAECDNASCPASSVLFVCFVCTVCLLACVLTSVFSFPVSSVCLLAQLRVVMLDVFLSRSVFLLPCVVTLDVFLSCFVCLRACFCRNA